MYGIRCSCFGTRNAQRSEKNVKKTKNGLTKRYKNDILRNVARKSASVAQLVEHHVANVIVAGSTPVTRSNFDNAVWQVSSVGRAGD